MSASPTVGGTLSMLHVPSCHSTRIAFDMTWIFISHIFEGSDTESFNDPKVPAPALLVKERGTTQLIERAYEELLILRPEICYG